MFDTASSDTTLEDWLFAQREETMPFVAKSDVLRLAPVDGNPPYRYVAEFSCKGLVETDQGIEVFDRHLVGISFPSLYLREPSHPGHVLTWLAPERPFHPNIRSRFICVGHIAPGMSLLNLLLQVHQIITWQRFTPREDDALNVEACRWARSNMERFPIDGRRSMLPDTAIDAIRPGGKGHE